MSLATKVTVSMRVSGLDKVAFLARTGLVKVAVSRRARLLGKVAVSLLLAALLLGLEGCVIVPQNRRGRLADPMMSFSSGRMDAYRNEKLHSTREGAAGGNGQPAGGGCACQ